MGADRHLAENAMTVIERLNRAALLSKMPLQLARDAAREIDRLQVELDDRESQLNRLAMKEIEARSSPEPSAEPVAWMADDGRIIDSKAKRQGPPGATGMFSIPLYGAPPRETPARFTAAPATPCSRCGCEWGRCNNTPDHVYHLCVVPEAPPQTTSEGTGA